MILGLQSPYRRSEVILRDNSKVIVIHLPSSAEMYSKEEGNQNVFRLSQNGKVLWRIAFQDPV
jgi:hypothetical protein